MTKEEQQKEFLRLRDNHLWDLISFFKRIDSSFDEKEVFEGLCDSYTIFLIEVIKKTGHIFKE